MWQPCFLQQSSERGEVGGKDREKGCHRKSQQSQQLTAPMHGLAALLLERKTLEVMRQQVLVTEFKRGGGG